MKSLLLVLAIPGLSLGCTVDDPEDVFPDAGLSGPDGAVGNDWPTVEGYCSAMVIGSGVVDIETDYLARVVACENGAASFEALKAQAVAARSYLYYKLDEAGSIEDGQGDQVYTCGNPPNADHMQAVVDTAGQVLTYMDVQVATFYVAGALQNPPECRGGLEDATNTELYVTYNEGLSGSDIIQTTLGFVSEMNWANRGCMSQNGSDCLSEQGLNYEDILRFYYGDDIVFTQALASCITPVL